MEGRGGFIQKGYTNAANALLPQSERDKKQQNKNKNKKGTLGGSKQTQTRKPGSAHSAWQQSGNKQNWTSLVKFLEREGLMPTVVFSFSKKVSVPLHFLYVICKFATKSHVFIIYIFSSS